MAYSVSTWFVNTSVGRLVLCNGFSRGKAFDQKEMSVEKVGRAVKESAGLGSTKTC